MLVVKSVAGVVAWLVVDGVVAWLGVAGVVACLVVDGVTDSETCPLSLVVDDVVSSGPGDV